MKRVMCIYLPGWPLQRRWRDRPELRDKPLAIVVGQAASLSVGRIAGPIRAGWKPTLRRGKIVIHCSARAAQAGVRPGMTLAEARTIATHLLVEEDEPAADIQALRQLATWAERYSPIVALEEGPRPESLFLDITGCAACFHGEDRLGQQALDELRAQGWHARSAIAGTMNAAWALAHYQDWRAGSVSDRRNSDGLPPVANAPGSPCKSLPIAALRLPDETIQILADLGIERIGQLVELPRPSIADRFGALVVERLDQMFGQLPESIVPHRSLPDVEASCSFEYPVERHEAVCRALEKLLEQIEEMLQKRHVGARCLECWLYHETAAPLRIEVGLFRPGRAARYLGKLLRTRLEQIRLEEAVTGLRLRVPIVETIAEHQLDLFESDEAPSVHALPALIDQLTSHLGRDAVTFATLVADHQPEYACRFEPAVFSYPFSREPTASADGMPRRPGIPPTLAVGSRLNSGGYFGRRPLRVLPAPAPIEVMSVIPGGAPLVIRRGAEKHAVERSWGPERIETGWWRGQDIQRDYYVIETEEGTRFWIFRRLDDGRWFLHGCFD
ncbi:MAG: DNA polymerase Y family protein [Planctomycetes bacterium]|nr:DNA polymerase Y family protein [Planctomycetota bacterium]